MREPAQKGSQVGRACRAFGMFWWDFLVGDTPELFVAALVVIGVTVALHLTAPTVVAWIVLPILVVVALGGSLWRAVRRSERRSGPRSR